MKANDVNSLFKNRKYVEAHGENGALFFEVSLGRVEYAKVYPCTNPNDLKYGREVLKSDSVFLGYAGGYSYYLTPEELVRLCSKKEFKDHDNMLRGYNTVFIESDTMRN